MNPPIVYEETRPSNQRMIKMTAMVPSISLLLHPWGGADRNHIPSDPPRLLWAAIPGSTQTETQLSASLTLSITFSTFCLIFPTA